MATPFTLGPLTLTGIRGYITATGERVRVVDVLEASRKGGGFVSTGSVNLMIPTLVFYSVDGCDYVSTQRAMDCETVTFNFTRPVAADDDIKEIAVQCIIIKQPTTLGPLTLTGVSGHITATGEKIRVVNIRETVKDAGTASADGLSEMILALTLYSTAEECDHYEFVSTERAQDDNRVTFHFTFLCDDETSIKEIAVQCVVIKEPPASSSLAGVMPSAMLLGDPLDAVVVLDKPVAGDVVGDLKDLKLGVGAVGGGAELLDDTD